MNEYNQTDAKFYNHYATGLEGDIQFYVEEAKKAGSPVLELGCGTGRILIPVAEAGISIVGLDHSSAMLSVARHKVSKLNAVTQRRIKLSNQDIRDFSLVQCFKLIMIPYRTFLHLLTPKDQRQALFSIREHLATNGLLIFNIFDPTPDVIAAHLGSLGSAIKKNSESTHPDTGNRTIVWEACQYDLERQVLKRDLIFEDLNNEGTVISKSYSSLTVRYIYRYEMQYLLELCGYSIEALYGDFQRGLFQRGAEQIWVARRS